MELTLTLYDMTVGSEILIQIILDLRLKRSMKGGNPTVWPTYRFPYDWQTVHEQESPSTPFAIAEFQGGSGEGWCVFKATISSELTDNGKTGVV